MKLPNDDAQVDASHYDNDRGGLLWLVGSCVSASNDLSTNSYDMLSASCWCCSNGNSYIDQYSVGRC